MRRLPTKYDEIKQRVMKVLTQVKHLSLTTDIWTSRATESFLTVTIHFIHSWKLKSLVLATVKFSTEHTGEHIADELQRITDHWEITHKVVGVVTDNASNMVAAIRITGWTHIHCFAHTLNLVVQEAIKNDPVLLLIKRKCKDTVTFFHQSVNAAEKLRAVQKQIGIQEKKLIQEVETRWNSSFYMFERMAEQYQAVTTALCLLNRNSMCFSAAELQHLKNAVTVLQPFETATTETSAENFFQSQLSSHWQNC